MALPLPTDIESGDTGHAGMHNATNTEVNTLGTVKADKAKTFNAQTGTAYTVVLADADKIITMTNASASTLTVPQNSDAALPVGTEITVIQLGAGQVTLVAGTGATLNSRGGLVKITAQYGVARLRKVSANGWIASGDLAA
jgi:hypothetical protein